MKFSPNKITLAMITGLLASVSSFSTLAQQEQDNAEKKEGIEHIEVTSRHKSESLNKIPLSVVSFSAADIEQKGLENINDLATNAVGFSMEKTFGRQSDIPVIRGVSWIPGFGSQKASYFIDGVFFSGSIQSLPLDLVERVEVIKGPQSALYGRRTFSGAINYITRRPEKEFGGYVNGTLGQNGKRNLSVGVSSKLSDEFSFRASFAKDSYDSEWENGKQGGPDVGGEKTTSGMIGLYYNPTPNTDIALNYIYNKNDDQHSVFMFQDASYNNCYLETRAYYCGEPASDLPISVGGQLDNDEYGLRATRKHLSFKLNHHFDFGTLTWISGMNRYDSENGIDQTYAGYDQVFSFGFFYGGPYFGSSEGWHTLNSGENKEYSHELRFSSSALDDRLNWSIGGYLWHEEEINSDPDVFDEEQDNSAIMGMVSYDVTDALRVSFEARRSEDEINSEAYNNLISTPGYENTSNKFSSTTTRFITEYDFSDDTMIYFTRSTGNSPGTFNTDAQLPVDLIVVEEEEQVMYELGVKTTQLDGSLYMSVAFFSMDWDKQQLTDSYIPDGDNQTPVSYVSNAGETEVNGFEIQGKYLINDNWNLDFGLSRTSAEFIELFDSNHCRIISGLSSAECNQPDNLRNFGNLKGNNPPQVPENEFVLGLNYETAIGQDMTFFGRVDYNRDSSRYAHVHNLIETGARSLVNLRAGVRTEDWTVSAWLKNATDDNTPTYIFRYVDAQTFAFSGRAFPIVPSTGREFGITASYRF